MVLTDAQVQESQWSRANAGQAAPTLYLMGPLSFPLIRFPVCSITSVGLCVGHRNISIVFSYRETQGEGQERRNLNSLEIKQKKPFMVPFDFSFSKTTD